jgi:hypothetical protein
LKSLLENAPKHFVGPPFSARGVLVRPDDRSINERAELVFIHLEPKRLEDGLPATGLCPSVKAVVDGLPAAEALGQVSPLHAGANAPDDCVDEVPVAALRGRTRPPAEQRLDALPFQLGQFVSVHGQR